MEMIAAISVLYIIVCLPTQIHAFTGIQKCFNCKGDHSVATYEFNNGESDCFYRARNYSTVHWSITWGCKAFVDQPYNTMFISDSTGRWQAWVTSNPDCMPLTDTSQYAVTIRPGGFSQGPTANYTCKPGHSHQSGNLIRICQYDNNWSGIAPNCVTDCGPPTAIKNGSYTLSQGTTYGSTATFQCQAGFQLTNGASSLVCDENSQWLGTHPVCKIVECSQLGDFPNGYYNLSSGTQYGSLATTSCIAGYEANHTANIVCGDNGNWTGSLPDCTPVDCGSAQNITNGTVVASGTTFGHTATYNCMPGFELVGPNLVHCNESDEWKPYVPSCQVKDISGESVPKKLYIMPCICYNKTFTGLTVEQIIAQLIRNTSIDTRNTTMALIHDFRFYF